MSDIITPIVQFAWDTLGEMVLISFQKYKNVMHRHTHNLSLCRESCGTLDCSVGNSILKCIGTQLT